MTQSATLPNLSQVRSHNRFPPFMAVPTTVDSTVIAWDQFQSACGTPTTTRSPARSVSVHR